MPYKLTEVKDIELKDYIKFCQKNPFSWEYYAEFLMKHKNLDGFVSIENEEQTEDKDNLYRALKKIPSLKEHLPQKRVWKPRYPRREIS